ncbi:MAG: hypothetical protein ACI4IQ_07915 [Eubacterium sp.]
MGKKALEISSKKRQDTFDIMRENGWDIRTQADRLAGYYKTGEIK